MSDQDKDVELESLVREMEFRVLRWMEANRVATDEYLAGKRSSLDTTELIDVVCRAELFTFGWKSSLPDEAEALDAGVRIRGRQCLLLTIMRDHGAGLDRSVARFVLEDMERIVRSTTAIFE